MNKVNRSLIIMLTFIFALGMLSGCSGGSKETTNTMGRYVEESINTPEEIARVEEMNILQDGSIAVIGYGEAYMTPLYFTSSDNGDSWEAKELKLPTVEEGSNLMVNTVKIMKDGSVLLIYTIEDMSKFADIDYENMTDEERSQYEEEMNEYYENLEYTAIIAGVDGNVTEANIPNEAARELYDSVIDENNNIFYRSYETESIVQIDLTTGEKKNEFKDENGYIQTWCINGETLTLGSFEQIKSIDIKTGKEKSKVENKDGELYTGLQLYAGKEDGEIYNCTEKGVDKLENGGKKFTQIIDGTLSSFGDSSNYLRKFLAIENNEFLALFDTMEMGTTKLVRYKFQADIAAKPENQITVYSLYENQIVRQAAVMYQKENPDVYINMETGISGYDVDESSISDAIKRLNTEIMAGKGPDILFLDELPIKSYIEKGLLADISDVFGGKDNEELFTNIIYGSENENGEIYSAPISFSLPIICGKNALEINSLSALASKIEEISNNAETSVLNVFEPDELVYMLYSSSGSKWINEDKTINKENIKVFLENTKTIFDSIKGTHSQEAIARHEEEKKEMTQHLGDMSFAEAMYSNSYASPHMLLEGKQEIVIGEMNFLQDFEMMEGMKNMDEKWAYDIWMGQDNNSVTPMANIGLSAKSEKQDIAKDFIKVLFSEDFQNGMMFYGLPTNKKVFKQILIGTPEERENTSTMGFGTDDGQMIEIEMKKFSEEKASEMTSKIEALNCNLRPDKEILKKSIDEFAAYVAGEKSIDEAIKGIENKLEIYLAE